MVITFHGRSWNPTQTMTSLSPDANAPFATIAEFRSHTRAHSELLDWCAARHRDLNPHFNAIRTYRSPEGCGEDGPLRGVPVTLKDNIGADSFDTWAGTTAPLPTPWTESGELVKRLQHAGAVVTSKSHCAEFAFGGSGFNPHHGTPRNPWDRHIHRAPGGSSSGTAVAVATGMAWFGIGTDTGGSVRVPASLCGCVGFRPTHGRWPSDGILPLSRFYDVPGVIARNATDLGLIASAIDRVNPRRPLDLGELRFNELPSAFLADCEPVITSAFERVRARLSQLGATFSIAPANPISDAITMLDEGPNTAAVAMARRLESELPEWLARTSPHVRRLIDAHWHIPEEAVVARHERASAFRVRHDELFGRADFLLLPTCPVGAPAVAMLSSDTYYERYSNALLRYTVLPSLYGCCALSLPIGRDQHGVPIGLQVVARHNDDQRLIACARSLETMMADVAPSPNSL